MSEPLCAVYVGRFQPPHAAHVGSVLTALDAASRVLVLLGSANLARSVKNPLTPAERETLFRAALAEAGADLSRVTFRPLPDRFDADLWAADVRRVAAEVYGPDARLALVGFEKDASSSYLRWFPDWERLPVPQTVGLNATDIRTALFEGRPLPAGLPQTVALALARFARTPTCARLTREWAALQAARAALPPGVTLHEERWLHVTGEQVWLRHRPGPIGQGLWEWPGRVLEPGQVAAPGDATFDHPARALVAPTVAQVFLGPPPASLASDAVPVSLETALEHPRLFHEDAGVILNRLLAEKVSPVIGRRLG
ncbi:MAG: adenylyltransferase/cytidyltransferase family protein [Deinococcus sp.]|uniref:adenylyltransferase/cytidyltransferase family protein n=1 Tax=Deinococcus sp. TaxID=47478 RepID=UPI0026DCD5E7|nr:adenylyltransferase/cytidyltransferase family protein [Deinococcus sp.]MDO4245230.1 adenylyltransferase/cytidyltransferase family protein [Deinococcus sp.]